MFVIVTTSLLTMGSCHGILDYEERARMPKLMHRMWCPEPSHAASPANAPGRTQPIMDELNVSEVPWSLLEGS